MSDTDIPHVDDVLELAELLQPTHAPGLAALRRSGTPLNADDGGSEGDDGGGSEDDGSQDDADQTDWKAEAEKWKAHSRKHEGTSKANAAAAKELAELKEAGKTEQQRAADQAAEAEKRATSAEGRALRLEVAMEKAPDGMSLAQVRKLAKRLAGSTQEELEQDAEELFADFAPAKGDDPRRRPRERLRPGAAPPDDGDDDGETDPTKLAAKVPRMY